MRGLAIAIVLAGCGFRSPSRPPDDAAAPPDADTCGNAVVDPGEECDDGNRATGDGCAACRIEPGWQCTAGTCVQVIGLAFTLAEALPSAGTSTGGGAFTHPCDPGAAIVGLEGDRSDDDQDMGRMRAACAAVAIGADGKLAWSTVKNTAYAASEQGGGLGTIRCATDSIVVGYTANAGQYLSGVQLACAPVSVVHGAVSIGAAITLPAFGPSTRQAQPAAQCATGEAATVFEGRSGAVFDHFDLRCAVVAAVTQ